MFAIRSHKMSEQKNVHSAGWGIRCIFILIVYWLWFESQVKQDTSFRTPSILKSPLEVDKIKETK